MPGSTSTRAPSGGFVELRHDPEDPASLPDDHIHHLLVDSWGDLWVATRRGGLSRRASDRDGFVHFRHDPQDPGSLADDAVTGFYEDRGGALWIGTKRGLDRLDRERGIFEHFRHDHHDEHGLSESYVRGLAEDRDGFLWVGTDAAGLNRLDRATGRFEHFSYRARDRSSLSNNRINVIYRDAAGSLWIGTANGLNQYLSEGRFRRFLERDGLPNTHVLGILGDRQGLLWLSTHAGLSRFDPETGEFRNYNARHGLQPDQFVRGAHLASREGWMFFGGENGFNYFDPAAIHDNPHRPPVVLTACRRFGEDVDLGVATAATEEIELSWKDHFLTFEFAALDFTSPRDNRYRYRLEGLDRDWIEAGDRRQAIYTNLDPGRYRLRVQGSNSDGCGTRTGSTSVW